MLLVPPLLQSLLLEPRWVIDSRPWWPISLCPARHAVVLRNSLGGNQVSETNSLARTSINYNEFMVFAVIMKTRGSVHTVTGVRDSFVSELHRVIQYLGGQGTRTLAWELRRTAKRWTKSKNRVLRNMPWLPSKWSLFSKQIRLTKRSTFIRWIRGVCT